MPEDKILPVEDEVTILDDKVTPEEKEEILPDETPKEESELTKVQDELVATKKEIEDIKAEAKSVKAIGEAADKRVKDAQDKMHAALDDRNKPEKEVGKTFDDYISNMGDKFEEDPRAAIEKLITDMAYDREIERQKHEKQLIEVEDKAYRRVMRADPEKAKLMDEVKGLDETRPDLENWTFDQKLEFIQLKKQKDAKPDVNKRDTNRDMLGQVSGNTKYGKKQSKMPDWTNDEEVLNAAKGEFESKNDMANWSDPKKASIMARELAEKQGEK